MIRDYLARHRVWLLAGAGAGIAAVSVAIGASDTYTYAGVPLNLSQANGVCTSAPGQLAQATSSRASALCSTVATQEHLRGWLWVAGLVVIAAAIVWGAVRSRRQQAPQRS